MGIIKRQGIKQSIVNYLATFIGAISIIFVYPHSEGMYGLAMFLTGAAALIAPFASMGANALTIRFFPTFKDTDQNHNGFLGILLLIATCFLLLFGIIIYCFETSFLNTLQKLDFNSDFIGRYNWHAYLLAIILVWTNILTSYSSNFGRIAIPAIFNSLVYKLALPILVLLFIRHHLTENSFAIGVIGYHFLGVLGLIAYIIYLGEFKIRPNLKFLKWPLIKSMSVFALFGLLGSLGSQLTFQIDRVMVPSLLDLKQATIYNIALFIGNSIEIPTRTIIAVTSPIIAQAWYNKDLEKIKELYTRASINLFLIGLLLFLIIWISLDDLFHLTQKYETLKIGQFVVFFVGVTKLFDMATSVNGQVIGYSKFFRFNLIAIIILGVSNVLLNYYFIQIAGWGITGPAIASLISVTLYNIVRVGFIWLKFNMIPFSWKNLIGIGIGLMVFAIASSVPNFGSPFINILINTILISLLYIIPLYALKISEDFNDLINNALKRIKFK